MKNSICKYLILIVLSMLNKTVYAEAQSITNIKGIVVGSCSLDFPATVALPDIPLKLLDEANVGMLLSDEYSGVFELKTNCTSAEYTIYFVATESSLINSCITGANGTHYLMFCLRRDDNINLPFKVDNLTSLEHENTNYGKVYASFSKLSKESETLVSVKLGRGGGKKVEAGKYMTPLTIIIQPM